MKKDINNMTFYELWEDYLNFEVPRLKVQSIRRLKSIFRVHLLPAFGNLKLKEINLKVYTDWQNKMDKTDYSFKYINAMHIYMATILNFAVKFYDLDKNIPSLVGTFNKNKRKAPKIDFWEYEEYLQFIHSIDDFQYKVFFETLYFTGMRLGECCALNWNDLIKDYIDVNKTITKDINPETGKHYIHAPKTPQSIRKIKINNSLIQDLKALKKIQQEQEDFSNDWFIFGGRNPLSQTTIGRRKNDYCEVANVKKIRNHDFRHSHASLLISNNIPVTVISQRLGHKDIATTLNTYSHLMLKDNDKAVNFIESLVSKS